MLIWIGLAYLFYAAMVDDASKATRLCIYGAVFIGTAHLIQYLA